MRGSIYNDDNDEIRSERVRGEHSVIGCKMIGLQVKYYYTVPLVELYRQLMEVDLYSHLGLRAMISEDAHTNTLETLNIVDLFILEE